MNSFHLCLHAFPHSLFVTILAGNLLAEMLPKTVHFKPILENSHKKVNFRFITANNHSESAKVFNHHDLYGITHVLKVRKTLKNLAEYGAILQ